MKKGVILVLTIFCIAFSYNDYNKSYGLKPSFSFGGGWTHLSVEGESENFIALGVGTIAPYSKYVGLTANIFGVVFGGGVTVIEASGRIGFIEMIPSKVVSPYFGQFVIFDNISGSGVSATSFGIGLGVGAEFASSSNMCPYIEGNFSFMTQSLGSISINSIGFGIGVGIRFNLLKKEEDFWW